MLSGWAARLWTRGTSQIALDERWLSKYLSHSRDEGYVNLCLGNKLMGGGDVYEREKTARGYELPAKSTPIFPSHRHTPLKPWINDVRPKQYQSFKKRTENSCWKYAELSPAETSAPHGQSKRTRREPAGYQHKSTALSWGGAYTVCVQLYVFLWASSKSARILGILKSSVLDVGS